MTSRQAKHNDKKRAELKAKGMSRFEAWIYPEFKEQIRAFIERLNKQRENKDDQRGV